MDDKYIMKIPQTKWLYCSLLSPFAVRAMPGIITHQLLENGLFAFIWYHEYKYDWNTPLLAKTKDLLSPAKDVARRWWFQSCLSVILWGGGVPHVTTTCTCSDLFTWAPPSPAPHSPNPHGTSSYRDPRQVPPPAYKGTSPYRQPPSPDMFKLVQLVHTM